jgi:hypothetical protein
MIFMMFCTSALPNNCFLLASRTFNNFPFNGNTLVVVVVVVGEMVEKWWRNGGEMVEKWWRYGG